MLFCEGLGIWRRGRLRRINLNWAVIECGPMGYIFALVIQAGAASRRPYEEKFNGIRKLQISNFKFQMTAKTKANADPSR